jgi:hypothetical protein
LRFLTARPWRDVAYPALIAAFVCFISYSIPPLRIAAPDPVTGVVTVSTDHPSETKPNAATYHSTATGNEPKVIRLPGINAEGFIQKVGVDQSRQIAVPTNIHLAGWFIDAVAPGDAGLSIIDGHLDGSSQPGIFANLGQLKPGDTYEIELASGSIRRFRVKTVQSLSVAAAASVLFSQIPGLARPVNLITCGGVFVKSAKSYDQRVVVISEYVSE